jgi:hypothetical protein
MRAINEKLKAQHALKPQDDLTDAGMSYAAACNRILEEVDEA